MEDDIRNDLEDSLGLLKSDRYKQKDWYSNKVISDIEKALGDVPEVDEWYDQSPEHIPATEKQVKIICSDCIFKTLCIDEWPMCWGAEDMWF